MTKNEKIRAMMETVINANWNELADALEIPREEMVIDNDSIDDEECMFAVQYNGYLVATIELQLEEWVA